MEATSTACGLDGGANETNAPTLARTATAFLAAGSRLCEQLLAEMPSEALELVALHARNGAYVTLELRPGTFLANPRVRLFLIDHTGSRELLNELTFFPSGAH